MFLKIKRIQVLQLNIEVFLASNEQIRWTNQKLAASSNPKLLQDRLRWRPILARACRTVPTPNRLALYPPNKRPRILQASCPSLKSKVFRRRFKYRISNIKVAQPCPQESKGQPLIQIWLTSRVWVPSRTTLRNLPVQQLLARSSISWSRVQDVTKALTRVCWGVAAKTSSKSGAARLKYPVLNSINSHKVPKTRQISTIVAWVVLGGKPIIKRVPQASRMTKFIYPKP